VQRRRGTCVNAVFKQLQRQPLLAFAVDMLAEFPIVADPLPLGEHDLKHSAAVSSQLAETGARRMQSDARGVVRAVMQNASAGECAHHLGASGKGSDWE